MKKYLLLLALLSAPTIHAASVKKCEDFATNVKMIQAYRIKYNAPYSRFEAEILPRVAAKNKKVLSGIKTMGWYVYLDFTVTSSPEDVYGAAFVQCTSGAFK